MGSEKDVKETVDTSSVDTSVTEDTSSADSLNTDTGDDGNEKSVPYERFKKINDRNKELEAEFQLHKAGIEISKAAMSDPIFLKEVNALVEKKNKGELTEKEFKQEIKEAKDKSEEKNSDVEDIRRTLAEDIATRYLERFKGKAKEDGYTEKDDMDLLEDLTTKELLKINSKPFAKYSPSDLDEAYEKAQKRLDGFNKRKTAGYVNEKKSDNRPASKQGTSVTKDVQFNSRSEESEYIWKALKGKKFDGE